MKEEISPEFEEWYTTLDKQAKELANAILEHVKKNDVRLLKKCSIRLNNCINEIKEIS